MKNHKYIFSLIITALAFFGSVHGMELEIPAKKSIPSPILNPKQQASFFDLDDKIMALDKSIANTEQRIKALPSSATGLKQDLESTVSLKKTIRDAIEKSSYDEKININNIILMGNEIKEKRIKLDNVDEAAIASLGTHLLFQTGDSKKTGLTFNSPYKQNEFQQACKIIRENVPLFPVPKSTSKSQKKLKLPALIPAIDTFEINKNIITDLDKSIKKISDNIETTSANIQKHQGGSSTEELESILSLKETIRDTINTLAPTDFIGNIISIGKKIGRQQRPRISFDNIDKIVIAKLGTNHPFLQKDYLKQLFLLSNNWNEFQQACSIINEFVSEFPVPQSPVPKFSKYEDTIPQPAYQKQSQKIQEKRAILETPPLTTPTASSIQNTNSSEELDKLFQKSNERAQTIITAQQKKEADIAAAEAYKQSIRDTVEWLKTSIYNFIFGKKQ